MRKKALLLLQFILFIAFTPYLQAQTTQASFTGKVTDAENKPLAGASVLVKNESTGFSSTTVTNTKGDYVFKELPLGGPYFIQVSFVGFADLKKPGYTLNQGDVVTVNFGLATQASEYNAVTVTATKGKGKIENLGAATAVGSRLLSKMPINGRNFTTLMDLSPLSRGGNIAGQLGSSTNYTIDGMNAKNPTSAGSTTSRSGAPYSISIEAVREFKVVTNQYDVTYGRSGGGTVSAVTKAGTNTLSGSVFGFGRADWLASPYDIRGNKRTNNYSTYQYGFSLGGPIIKDKLHFFLAWDHQDDMRSLVIADIQSAADEARFGISKVSLDSVIKIGREKYGIGPEPQYGSFDKKRKSDAAFLRLDWQINRKNLLTIRNNLTNDINKLGLIDNTAINLYESAGNDYNFDNSFLVTLRSSLNSKVTNELKLQHLYTYQSSEPGDVLPSANIPRAIVERIPSIINGASRNNNVQFGGHRFAQEWFRNNVFQLVNNLYFNTNAVKYTFGIDYMYTKARSVYGSEVNGRFHYDGFQNFIDNKPFRYYREVPITPDQAVTSNIHNIGLYGQMQTKLGTGLDMTAGLRFDYSIYPNSPFKNTWYLPDYISALGEALKSARSGTFPSLFLAMLITSIPFIWMGTAMTIRRLRDIGLSVWLVLIFFFPYINILFFLLLCLLPTRKPIQTPTDHRWLAGLIPKSGWANAAVTVILTSFFAVVFGGWIIYGFKEYGTGLFIGLPFMQGLTAAVLSGYHKPQTLKRSVSVALASVFLFAMALFVLAMEGLVCIIMAAPIGFFIAAIGAIIGHQIQLRTNRGLPASLLLFGSIPLLSGAEQIIDLTPPLQEVTTEIVINNSKQAVWNQLVTFNELQEPKELMFRSGVAYPIKAEIEGKGPGAVRKCVFTTGAFIEPIEIWDEPDLLRFSVDKVPPPLIEMSIYDSLHLPHLEGYFVSERGQFKLTAISPNKTLLQGTTWYRHDIWPGIYWKLWSDHILHTIHNRVLTHIKEKAESVQKVVN